MADALADMLEGRCLCGAVSIRLEQRQPVIDVCHCTMCRRWSGGPLFTLRSVSDEALAITGEEHIAVFHSSQWAERAFCARCGSGLWYRFLPHDRRSLLAGLFELPASYAISEQIFVDERAHWAKLAADTPEKTGDEVMAEAKVAGFDFG